MIKEGKIYGLSESKYFNESETDSSIGVAVLGPDNLIGDFRLETKWQGKDNQIIVNIQ